MADKAAVEKFWGLNAKCQTKLPYQILRFCETNRSANTLKRIKNATSKICNLGYHNKFITLIFICLSTHITWIPFMFSFSHNLSRLVCDVTWYVICVMRLWLIVRNFRPKFLMKLNTLDDLLLK